MIDTAKALANDLAKSRDHEHWITWTEIPLGSVLYSNGRVPRADVLSIRKSYQPHIIIYEIKATRSDFLSDVNRGKYRTYFDYCSQLYFAAPKGLLSKEEIPESCGLIVQGNGSWHVTKAAQRRECTPSVELLLKLLMRGYENWFEEWKQHERLKNLEYKGLKEASLSHGIRLGQDLGNASELIAQAEELRKELSTLLGRSFDSPYSAIWALKSEVDALITQRIYAEELLQLADLSRRLATGDRHFIENIPGALRNLATKLETKSK